MAAIELNGLTKRFGAVTAVDNLTLELGAGTVTGLLGPNGAGKTTTLRMLLGLVAPSAGSATFGGRRYVDLDEPARHVGAVLEASSFHPGRRAVDHLRILASAAGLPAQRVHEALAQVGMTEHAHRRVGGFSLGMRQRLGLAGALLGEPSVLVLDEPANGLDPEGVHWLRRFLRSQADAGRTVVVSSHLLAEVAQTVDHVVILDKGRLVTSAPLAELTARSRSAVIVRTPDADRLRMELTRRGIDAAVTGPDQVTAAGTTPEVVGRVIGAIGLVIYEMRIEESNLEDVFFSLTTTEGATVMNRLVRTELLKQRTTRTFVAGICAAPAVAGLVTIAILSAAGKQGNDPLGPDSLVHVIGGPAGVITLIAALLGVLGMAGEYRHQTITTTFLASPRRRDVVVAKLVAHSLAGALMGLLSLAVSVAIAVPWLRATGVDVYLDGEGVRVAAGLVASTALYGALGVSIGALLRNQTIAAAVAAGLAARRRGAHRRPGPRRRLRAVAARSRRPGARPHRPEWRRPRRARRRRHLRPLHRRVRRRRRPPHRRPRHHLITPSQRSTRRSQP